MASTATSVPRATIVSKPCYGVWGWVFGAWMYGQGVQKDNVGMHGTSLTPFMIITYTSYTCAAEYHVISLVTLVGTCFSISSNTHF